MGEVMLLSDFRTVSYDDIHRECRRDLSRIVDLICTYGKRDASYVFLDVPVMNKLEKYELDHARHGMMERHEEQQRISDLMGCVVAFERVSIASRWMGNFAHLDYKNITPHNIPRLERAADRMEDGLYDVIIAQKYRPAAQAVLQISAVTYDRVERIYRAWSPVMG